MRNFLLYLAAGLLVGCVGGGGHSGRQAVLVVHGGAGTIVRSKLTPELEQEYRAKLTEALETGFAVLHRGGTSLDAVESTLVVLEDSPLFNAGRGAVFTNEETVELDASIMSGSGRNAGAIAGVRTVKNPIRVARAVMENSEHVLLAGRGAEEFAETQGAVLVPNSYFHTERRLQQLRAAQAAEQAGRSLPDREIRKSGTVGAVAVDAQGNLAAGTSTGGMTNKRFGRIGDSPIIGAGTWADNDNCAVSATGHGEFFIRLGIAQDIASRMKYRGCSVAEAGDAVIHTALTDMVGTGGVIILDRHGNFATPFNTEGMYRGWVDTGGKITVKIFGNE